MNRSLAQSLLLPMALATILAAGALLAWMIAFTWSWSVASQLMGTQQPNEQLVFTDEGQPLVQSTTYGPNNMTVYRTLDGQTVNDLDHYELQSGNSWMPAGNMPHVREISWYSRVIGFAEPGGVPNYWYLVLDGQQPVGGYFQGFDARTKREIGYLGRGGFRTDPPPPPDRFEIDGNLLSYWGLFAGQSGNQGQEPYGYWRESPPAIFMVSGGALVRVDLRHRTVTNVPVDGKIVSVGNVGQPVRLPDKQRALEKRRIGVRLADRILLLDEDGQPLGSISLPAEVRERLLIVYRTIGPDAIVVAMADVHHELTEVYWLTPQGEVERHERLRLRGGFFGGGEQPAWQTVVSLPSPLVCAILFTIARPQQSIDSGVFSDFPTALTALLAETWSALVVLVIVSAVLAVFCYRRQLRTSRSGSAAWAAFVLATGPPGLIGYLVHRRWPAVARCAQCGASVPRDRDECLVCAADFPAPAPRAIEIFA